MPEHPRLSPLSTLSPGRFALLFFLLSLLVATPLAVCGVLPLFDYPNHLARMFLLANLGHSPNLDAFYSVAWRPVPNLAMDLVVPPLLSFLPLIAAGKVFVLITFLLTTAGAAALHRVLFGRWSAWGCLAFLLLYSRILLWGFLNYLTGVGICLCGIAAWIGLRRAALPLRLSVGAAFAMALYFAHLMAFGSFAVLVAGYEVGEVIRERLRWRPAAWRLVIGALPFLPVLAMMAIFHGAAEGGIVFGKPWRKFDLLFSIFDDYSRPFDVFCFALTVGAAGLAFSRRWIRLAPELAFPLAFLGLAYLALPSQLWSASGADHRLPLVLALVVAAGSCWAVDRPRLERGYLGGAALLFLVRLGVVAVHWHGDGRIYDELLAGMDRIPPGSLVGVAYPDGAVNVSTTPLVHLPTLEIARRQAFIPTLFAEATQQPIALRPPYDALAAACPPELLWEHYVDGQALDAIPRTACARFDFVVLLDRRPLPAVDSTELLPVFTAPRLQLFRLQRDTLDPANGHS